MDSNFTPTTGTDLKRGVLIINLGSPDSTDKKDIRKFLKLFLGDKRVVTLPRPLWYPILYGFVLTLRPGRIQETYESIWGKDGSPLVAYTRAQAEALAAELPDVVVKYAFNYSTPLVSQALDEMKAEGVNHLTVISAYPQYAPSTVAATMDQVSNYFKKCPSMPHLQLVSSWQVAPTYINWYAEKLAENLARNPVDALVFSYHSLPDQTAHEPEQYKAHCTETTEVIIGKLRNMQVEVPEVIQTYQSKFGPGKWIGPATIDTMAKLPKREVKRITVLTPGFFADCIETVDEISVLNREEFIKAGGDFFNVVSPPNADPAAGKMLAEVYRQHNPDYHG